jgi:hypothetical protein
MNFLEGGGLNISYQNNTYMKWYVGYAKQFFACNKPHCRKHFSFNMKQILHVVEQLWKLLTTNQFITEEQPRIKFSVQYYEINVR